MYRRWVLIGSLLAMIGVAIGAFGTHGLSATLEANGRTDTFHTATQYQMYHALALLAVGWLSRQSSSKWVPTAGYLFVAGILLFSGSLYILAVFNLPIMGAIAPLGGASLIAGWGCLAWSVWRED